MKHAPISMSNAKISLGTKKKDNFHRLSQEFLSKMSIDMVGNFIILACNVAISSLVKVAKLFYTRPQSWTHLYIGNYSLKRTEIWLVIAQ